MDNANRMPGPRLIARALKGVGLLSIGFVSGLPAAGPAAGSYRIVASSQTFARGLYRLQVHRMPQ